MEILVYGIVTQVYVNHVVNGNPVLGPWKWLKFRFTNHAIKGNSNRVLPFGSMGICEF